MGLASTLQRFDESIAAARIRLGEEVGSSALSIISPLADSVFLGHVMRFNLPGAGLLRQTVSDAADRELWIVTARMLGAMDNEIELHEAVVREIAGMTPMFSTRDVCIAGWTVLLARLRRGLVAVPDNAVEWALELFRESIYRYQPRQIDGAYLKAETGLWIETATRLWVEEE